MNTKAIIGVSILAVVLLVLGSQANVVGYQTVQSSVKERLNEKDLLFQTICDLANNKDVQKAILESQGKFQNPFPAPQLTSFHAITKKQVTFLCNLGHILSKSISKTRVQSIMYQCRFQTKNQIESVINNNPLLAKELQQLSLSNCNCNELTTRPERICNFLEIILIATVCVLNPFIELDKHFNQDGLIHQVITAIMIPFIVILFVVGGLMDFLDCFWYPHQINVGG